MRSFAIIPAAGRSQRMGTPKLLLPWAGRTVIEHVVATWRASQVSAVIVVLHAADTQLAELARAGSALVVQPCEPPEDMKASILLGLARAAELDPLPDDAWLVAPADMPGLTTLAIDQVLAAYAANLQSAQPQPGVWTAQHGDRRGHPVLLPWRLATEVSQLASNEGLKTLVDRQPIHKVEVGSDAQFDDLDTPADYARLQAKHRPLPDSSSSHPSH